MVGAVILAAGAGRRMGGIPKALLQLDGVTFLETIVRSCREAGCTDAWVVTRPEAKEVLRIAFDLDVQPVPNPEPEQGMFSSVQKGIEAAIAEPELRGIILFPVDHPHVLSRTIRGIAAAIDHHPGKSWIQPGYRGRGGHPIGLSIESARLLAGLPPTSTLRDALRAAGLAPVILPINDPGVVTNVNTPDDHPER